MFQTEDVDYFGKVGFGEGIRSEEDWGLFGGSNEYKSDEHPDF